VSKDLSKIILPAIFLVIGLAGGYFAAKSTSQAPVPVQTEKSENNLLYSNQTAVIRGKITSVDGNTIKVRNIQTDTVGGVKVSDKVIITKPGAKSADLNVENLETDKEVLIGLEMIDGDYQAVSIQYSNPAPSLPPLPSPTPKTAG
jgi:hypothetical protein